MSKWIAPCRQTSKQIASTPHTGWR